MWKEKKKFHVHHSTARYYKRDDDHMAQIVFDLIKILQFFSCRRSHRILVLSTKFWLFHKLQYAQRPKKKKSTVERKKTKREKILSYMSHAINEGNELSLWFCHPFVEQLFQLRCLWVETMSWQKVTHFLAYINLFVAIKCCYRLIGT